MTAAELINRYDTERPNQVDADTKLEWLKKVDRMIMNEAVLTHCGDERFTPIHKRGGEKAQPFDQKAYFEEYGLETELIADSPYEDVYLYYMDMRTALNANDTKRYNMMSTLYNNAMITFQQYYNRTYRPVRKSTHFLRHENL